VRSCQLHIRGSFKRDLKKLDETTRKRVQDKLEMLKENPYLGKPLKSSYEKLWRCRVGKYRILYYPQPCRVILIKVRPRDSIY